MTKLPITDLDAYVSKDRYVGHQLLFARWITVFPQQIADDGRIPLGTQAARVVYGVVVLLDRAACCQDQSLGD